MTSREDWVAARARQRYLDSALTLMELLNKHAPQAKEEIVTAVAQVLVSALEGKVFEPGALGTGDFLEWLNRMPAARPHFAQAASLTEMELRLRAAMAEAKAAGALAPCTHCGGPRPDDTSPLCEDCVRHACAVLPAGKCPPHRWDRDGERCLDCGDKDWMTDGVASATEAQAGTPAAKGGT